MVLPVCPEEFNTPVPITEISEEILETGGSDTVTFHKFLVDYNYRTVVINDELYNLDEWLKLVKLIIAKDKHFQNLVQR